MVEHAERVNHPRFARLYMRAATSAEDEYRRELLAGLTGAVIEVGAGHGLNFPFYPPGVQRVLAIEPEPLLRSAAVENAARASVPVEVVDGVAGRLPVEDGSFGAGIASLVLCSVRDPQAALAELRRVIRPGGELRYYEHVASDGSIGRAAQRLADATLWPRVAGGCHLARDTGAEIERAGFEIKANGRFSFSPAPPLPPIPHILGIARRPWP